jgi:nuclear GTP-binding protein
MASEPTLSTLAILASEAEASSLSQKFEDPVFSDTPGLSISGRTKEQMRKYYIRSLHKVVDQSDIILLVLDARDPEGCRSRLVEEEVRRRESEGKKLIFVLNKIGRFQNPLLIVLFSSLTKYS